MSATGDSLAIGSPNLRVYDYVRLLTRSRVAWEYLRRNPDYRRDWRQSSPDCTNPVRLTNDTTLLRLRRRFRSAEVWGLCSFRRS